jgi:hypothetical protein
MPSENSPLRPRQSPDPSSSERVPASPSPAVLGFAVIYRVRLHPGMESQYIAAWSRVTERLRAERGGLGSRLHRGPEGIWYAYAQWPTAAARTEAFALGPVDAEAERQMRDAISERLAEIVLEPVADYLLPVRHGA